jgi:curved DNA-binding protein CbpA
MGKSDHYDILGVSKDASGEDMKKAYCKMAVTYHPEKNPGDEVAEEKFQEIAEAYEKLKDSNKRATYDRYGHSAFEYGGGAQIVDRELIIIVIPSTFFVKYLDGVDSVIFLHSVEVILKDQGNRLGIISDMIEKSPRRKLFTA